MEQRSMNTIEIDGSPLVLFGEDAEGAWSMSVTDLTGEGLIDMAENMGPAARWMVMTHADAMARIEAIREANKPKHEWNRSRPVFDDRYGNCHHCGLVLRTSECAGPPEEEEEVD